QRRAVLAVGALRPDKLLRLAERRESRADDFRPRRRQFALRETAGRGHRRNQSADKFGEWHGSAALAPAGIVVVRVAHRMLFSHVPRGSTRPRARRPDAPARSKNQANLI